MKKIDKIPTDYSGSIRNGSSEWNVPADFFEAQRKRIWESAMNDTDAISQHADSKADSQQLGPKSSVWRRWSQTQKMAAAWVVLFGGIWVNQWVSVRETCVTFACLWEQTDPTEFNLSEGDIEIWLEDDLLFQEINEVNPG